MPTLELDIWRDKVAEHDFDAAEAYLSLRFAPKIAEQLVKRLTRAKITKRRSNDILRASRLPPLSVEDPGVRRNLQKVLIAKEKLSPVLLISFEEGLEICDGYHRVSFAYLVEPDVEVPCVIISA